MRIQLGVVLASLGLMIVTMMPASAHHSFSVEFDTKKPLILEGTLVEWEMINPHSWFHIDVKGDDGEVVRWMVEGGSPNQLIRMGVTKNTISIGTELIIEGYQARDGTNKAVGRNFVLSDGSRLFLGGSASKIKVDEE
tara:strand:- start:51 stop:464 length:414 start_codon:yes stop_codon:yes gene_type:complete